MGRGLRPREASAAALTDSLCRSREASAAAAALCPGAGGMVAGDVVRAGRLGGREPGRAAAEHYLLPHSWWLHAQVSRDAPPPLPGGYTVGDQVFFTGASETFPSGDKLVHGQQGEVTGPAALETHKGKGVAVRFPGNKGNVGCPLTQVRRPRAAPAARAHAYVAPL